MNKLKKSKDILKNIFGYDEFRPLQKNVIENILDHKDTLVIMPTGGGKSLCYQIPALIFSGLTVVISPLISLMKDQIEQLHELNINAVVLNSTLSYEEYEINKTIIKNNETKLLYVAPETLLMPKTIELLKSVNVECITIDEAHCISEWGHDFRPQYRQIAELRKEFSNAVCIALTATATPHVQQDIKNSLEFEDHNEFIDSFNRKNLFLEIIEKNNPLKQTINILDKFKNESGIIYCFSRKQVNELTETLIEKGYSVKPYHAGLSDKKRQTNQELFTHDDIKIIVATIAFGMGINKPNIRFVIHYDIPQNIESYYQQIGRAGRDGLNSHCFMLFSYGDIQKIRYFIDQKNDQEKRIANIHLNHLLGFIETDQCRRIPLMKYFGETYHLQNCKMCDNCVFEKQDSVDITIEAQKFLSCVKRTGEIFGSSHIIDVLRGSENQKVTKFDHHNLSTYGIGKNISKKQWTHLSRQFLSKGLLEQDIKYGSLKLTNKAWKILKGTEKFFGKLEKFKPNKKKHPKISTDYKYDTDLFEILRKERKKLADESNLPPFVIFSDKTIIEMSAFLPQNNEDFLKINGVGKVKLEKYGDIFLDIIRKYCN